MVGKTTASTVVFFSVLATCGLAIAEQREDISKARQELTALAKSRPPAVTEGSLASVSHYLDVADRYWGKGHESKNARRYLRDARKALSMAKAGEDPLAARRGFVVRAYRSKISTELQPYSIYVPDNYDPSTPTPMMVVLHGGSSNHSLFLGVVFGNNEDWLQYSQYLRRLYSPRFPTDWIVVAPNGFGQVMWRWMGEQDVLDVMEDVQRHYNIDQDQIFLNGISNGGVGSYSIGARHAWRFAAVLPMAGAPSWWQYLRIRTTPLERRLISAFGAWDSSDNLRNTHFEFFHGNADTGPMRPHFVTNFRDHLEKLGVPHRYHEYAMGHDIMYRVHQRMKILKRLSKVRRDPRPEKVHLVSWDYRAPRQFWLEATRYTSWDDAGRATGEVTDSGAKLSVITKNLDRFRIHLATAPVSEDQSVELIVDGTKVSDLAAGATRQKTVDLHRTKSGAWSAGEAPVEQGLRKIPGLSGPLPDVLQTCQFHVYGTGVERDTKTLKKAAQQASRGIWVQWAWDYRNPVVPDTAVTVDMMKRCSTVLYGNTKSNSVLAKVASKLPIGIEDEAIVFQGKRYTKRDVGTRFIYPNPLAPKRYLVVQAGNSASAVRAGNKLPDFLPDYVIYNKSTTSRRPRGIFGRNDPVEAGMFTNTWQLPPPTAE